MHSGRSGGVEVDVVVAVHSYKWLAFHFISYEFFFESEER